MLPDLLILNVEGFNADIISSFTFTKPPTSSHFTVWTLGAPIDFVNIKFILSRKNNTGQTTVLYLYLTYMYTYILLTSEL